VRGKLDRHDAQNLDLSAGTVSSELEEYSGENVRSNVASG
jgi:hypothetical protein